MQTFKIKNGDIAVDVRGRVENISGAEKVGQDLRNFLLNNLNYNRFHPWIGSHLDSFVGQPVNNTLLQKIKSDVRDCLTLYNESMMQDLRLRVEERGNAPMAISMAGPNSLIRTWTKLEVKAIQTSVYVTIGFVTYTNEESAVNLELALGGYN